MKGTILALGRLKTGAMNKTEAAYERELFTAQIMGDVLWYRFEGVKLRLADNTFYTPDFAVMVATGQLEMHEVKGHWMDDARPRSRSPPINIRSASSPSTPLSNQNRIMEKTSSRTLGFSQLRSGCFCEK